MFNILNQAEKKKNNTNPGVMIAGFTRWRFSKADSVVAPNGAKNLCQHLFGGDDGVQAPAPHLPAPSFLPEWPLSAPALSILGRQLPPSLHHFFHSRPVSMATDRLKDELQSGSGEAARLEVRSPGGGVCP